MDALCNCMRVGLAFAEEDFMKVEIEVLTVARKILEAKEEGGKELLQGFTMGSAPASALPYVVTAILRCSFVSPRLARLRSNICALLSPARM